MAAAAHKDVASAREARRRPKPSAAAAPSAGRPGVWVVQVQALKDRGAAAALAQRLVGKGYPAFVLEPGRRRPVDLSRAGGALQRPPRSRAGRAAAREGRAVQALDFALALLSGALLALSFPKFGHPASAWIALAPLMVAVSSRSATYLSPAYRTRASSLSLRRLRHWSRSPAGRAFALGLLTGAVYFAGTLYWLVETMTTFGGLSTPLAVCRGGAAHRLPRAVSRVLRRDSVHRCVRTFGTPALLLAPAVWVATELGRTYIWDGFPWELLGYSQVTVLPIAQLASVVGVYGLSALVALVSAACAYAAVETASRALAVRRSSPRLRSSRPASGAASASRASPADDRRGRRSGSAVVQGNVEQEQKWDPALADAILRRYIDMTREAIGARRAVRHLARVVDAVQLRRGAAARRDDPPAGARGARHAADRQRSDRASGTARRQAGRRRRATSTRRSSSGRTARTGGGLPQDSPRAVRRIRAVQAVCCSSSARSSKRSPTSRRVPRPTLLPVAGHMVSTAICYEVIFASLIRSFVTRGQRAADDDHQRRLVRPLVGAYQHWEQASMRAIEEGRYLARAANTGISGFVDPYGRVLQRSNMFEQRGDGRGPPVHHRRGRSTAASATLSAGASVALTLARAPRRPSSAIESIYKP